MRNLSIPILIYLLQQQQSFSSNSYLYFLCFFQPDLCTSEEGVAEYKGSPFVTSAGHITSSLKNAQISWRLFVVNPMKCWNRLSQLIDSKNCRLNLIATQCLVSELYIYFLQISCDEFYLWDFPLFTKLLNCCLLKK